MAPPSVVEGVNTPVTVEAVTASDDAGGYRQESASMVNDARCRHSVQFSTRQRAMLRFIVYRRAASGVASVQLPFVRQGQRSATNVPGPCRTPTGDQYHPADNKAAVLRNDALIIATCRRQVSDASRHRQHSTVSHATAEDEHIRGSWARFTA